ncbi:MAG: META domain-containing protein [Methanolobus sp.]|uniref:META domain-containing protein n=1 Tax=Methanolobus sp. TaxID=1874737 RepID=UPI00272F8870|nr:META domain-containing protein [Methanolobus sp.]MDP2216986.1 META domain-containing protein [Methanolobus sp.]
MLNTQKILTLLLICALLSAALLVSGCADITDITEETSNGQSGTHTDSEAVSIDDITDIKWHWSSLTGDDAGNLSTIPDPQRYTIQFSKDGTYGIMADCNAGGGEYALVGDKLMIEPGFTTLAYCGPESLDTQYLSFLHAVTGFSIVDEKLVLSLEEEGKQMIFVKESPAAAEDILDIEWQWTGIVEATEDTISQTAVPEPENYNIIFQADERYSIKADCNVGSGEYAIKGNNLTVSTPSLTRAYCGPDSMDMLYLSMLSNITAFSLENGRLVLSLGGSGDEMIFDKGRERRL